MADRLPVVKTWKLFMGGAFPRSESGRLLPVHSAADRRKAARGGAASKKTTPKKKTTKKKTVTKAATAKALDAIPPMAYVAHASRKDLRDAVEAAAKAQESWAARDASNRGQILHRLAELMEERREALGGILRTVSGATPLAATRELDASIDRLISYAGWADKYGHVLGTHDPVSGPYYTFTVPEATGVIVLFCPPEPALLGFVQQVASALCTGNAVVAIVPAVGPEANPLPALHVAETCNASDIPHGVVNVLTGDPSELVPHVALHRGVDGVSVAASGMSDEDVVALRAGAAENLKRVHVDDAEGAHWFDHEAMSSPWVLERFVEFKTIWHPSRV